MAKSNLSAGFAGFLLGVMFGLGIAATAALLIYNSPRPFMEKVQKVTADVDPAEKLAGSVDPNKRLNTSSDVDNVTALTTVKTVDIADEASEPARDKTGKAINPGTVTPVTYWLQTGAYKERSSAEAQCAELAMNLFSATVIESKGLWLVRVGPYETNQMAKEIQNQLSNSNIRSTIVTNR